MSCDSKKFKVVASVVTEPLCNVSILEIPTSPSSTQHNISHRPSNVAGEVTSELLDISKSEGNFTTSEKLGEPSSTAAWGRAVHPPHKNTELKNNYKTAKELFCLKIWKGRHHTYDRPSGEKFRKLSQLSQKKIVTYN